MIHLGDITKIKGNEAPIVDVITGGSPCQDLSVAGKRAGLAGERSGLFMEQIRIIKEMRNVSSDDDRRVDKPRFMVWENVYGAFSSNNGEDFRAVLEETAKVKDKNASIPRPADGKWQPCGAILGDGYSLAWRGHDAQYWGVPQRRKRICLLADFEGGAAPRILFESELWRTSDQGEPYEVITDFGTESRQEVQPFSESMSGNTQQSRETGKDITSNTEGSSGTAISFQERAGKPGGGKGILIQNEHIGALSTLNNQSVCYGISSYDSNAMKSSNPQSGIYEADTSRTLDLNGGSPACNQGGMAVVMGIDGYNQTLTGDKTMTLTETASDLHHIPCITYSMGHDIRSARFTDDEITDPLTATDYKDPIKISDFRGTYQNITGTLDCGIAKGTGNQLANQDMFIANMSVVRRLTPKECLRLQGYPDGWYDIGEWTDSKGKKHKEADAPKYKAAGNSIALPFWKWLAKRICVEYDRPVKMASLFDGIGGFPLSFSEAGAIPVWASEIEEFPIAVTKARFGGE